MPPFLTLLLQASVFDHPAARWVGGIVIAIFLAWPTLEKMYDRFFGGQVATRKAWEERVDRELAKFMPQGDIKDELNKLGKQIGENEGKIKLLHDRGEEVANSQNMRLSTLEQHNVALTLLPGEVNTLKTDYRVLASEFRTLAGSVEKLSEKQDKHFTELMRVLQNLAYTRGELHSGQNRPIELP